MFFIAVISAIIYTVAIIAIYHNLYNFDKRNKIKFIIAGCIIVLVITIVLVVISSANLEMPNKEYKEYKEYLGITKTISILLFAPINAIMVLPYVGNLLNKYEEKRINEEKLKRKFLILFIVLIIIAIFEVSYIRDFQIGLLIKA